MIIVMEFAKGSELFCQLVEDYKNNNLNERTTKMQFYQVVDTVRYLHSKQVCHRDLKLVEVFGAPIRVNR
jgi:serine/threonine protein kinase